MAIIEPNWDFQRKDLRLFGIIGTIVFGTLALGQLLSVGPIMRYGGNLLSWKLLGVFAVLSVIGSQLKVVPASKKHYGIMGAIILGAVAALFFSGVAGPFRFTFPVLAAYFALGLIAVPDLLRPVYSMALVATLPIGLVVGPVIMGVIFFGIFTPAAMIMKLIGRDTMCRRFDDAAPTYWIARPPTTDVKRYFRQF